MELLLKNYIDMISKQFNKSELELKKINYGLKVIMLNLSKFIIIVMVAYILNLCKYALLTILLMIVMKKYCFGLHAKSNRICTAITTAMVLGTAYVSKYRLIGMRYVILIAILAFIGICKYAPADTKAHPLIGKKLRANLRRKAIVSVISAYGIAFILNKNDVTIIVVLTAFIQSIMINPLTYKLLNREWNNYEKYNEYNE